MSHRQYPKKGKNRERNLQMAKERTTISAVDAPVGGPKVPIMSCPKSWTSEFCRANARRAKESEDYNSEREWRMRSYVIEHHNALVVRETNRPHPYRFMKVDAHGREMSTIELTSAIKEAILGSAECKITQLPVTA